MAHSDSASQPFQASDTVFAPKAQPSRPLASVQSNQSSDGLALLLAAANDTTDTGRESPRRGDSAQARLQHGVHRVSPASSALRPLSSASSRALLSGQDKQSRPTSQIAGDGSNQQPVAMTAAPFHHQQAASSSAIGIRASPAKTRSAIEAKHPPYISASTAETAETLTRSRESFTPSAGSPDAPLPGSSPSSASLATASLRPLASAAAPLSHPLLHPAGSIIAPQPRSTPSPTATRRGPAVSTGLLHVSSSFPSGSPTAQQQQQRKGQLLNRSFGLHPRPHSYQHHQSMPAPVPVPPRPAWADGSHPLPGGVGTVTPVFLVTLRAGGGQHILRANEFDILLADLNSAMDAAPGSAPLSDAALSAVLRASAGSSLSGGPGGVLSPQRSSGLLSGLPGSLRRGAQTFATPKHASTGIWHSSPSGQRGLAPHPDTESGGRGWRGRGERTPATLLAGGFSGDSASASSRSRAQQDSQSGSRHSGVRKRSRSRRLAAGTSGGDGLEALEEEEDRGLDKRYAGVDRDAVGLAPGADRFGMARRGRGHAGDDHDSDNDGDDDDEDFVGSARGRAAPGGRAGERRGGRRSLRGSAMYAPQSTDSASTAASRNRSRQSQSAYPTRNARAGRKDAKKRGSAASTHGTGTLSESAQTPLRSAGVATSAPASVASSSSSSGTSPTAASSASASASPSGAVPGSALAPGPRSGRQRTGEYITSTFRGVYGRSSAKASGVRWAAHASDGKRKVHLGYFNSAEEAAMAYDTAVMRFKGPTAITNFRYDARGNRSK